MFLSRKADVAKRTYFKESFEFPISTIGIWGKSLTSNKQKIILFKKIVVGKLVSEFGKYQTF
jgi:hypothetical protein